MGEWAYVCIFAISLTFDVWSTKLCFVLVRVVKFFDPVMREAAILTELAVLLVHHVWATFCLVSTWRPSSIFPFIMEIHAFLFVVRHPIFTLSIARIDFEIVKIKHDVQTCIEPSEHFIIWKLFPCLVIRAYLLFGARLHAFWIGG